MRRDAVAVALFACLAVLFTPAVSRAETPDLWSGSRLQPVLPDQAPPSANTFELRDGQICNFINFEGRGDQVPIGTVAGNPNVTFGNSWLVLLDGDNRNPPDQLNGNFANEPSASHIAFFLDPVAPINFDAGVQFIEVYYSAAAASLPVTLRGWSGLNGTGSIVATATGNTVGLDEDGARCSGDPTGAYCLWVPIQLTAPSNTIRSVTLLGTVANRFGFDNMTFCTTVPETGACCRPGDVCTVTTPDNCASVGGRYLGANSQCASCNNIPPIPVNFPANNETTVNAYLGQSLAMPLGFLSPEANQTTSVVITDVHNAGARGLQITNTPGNVATIMLTWTPTCSDEADYRLDFVATDSYNPPGVTNISLTIHVICPCGRPIFNLQPADQSVCPGAAVTFTAAANGDQPISYQWQKDGVNIPGATASSYTIFAVVPSDAGLYRVVASNSCTTTNSGGARLTVLSAPVITQDPVGHTNCPGDSVTFTVGVSGSEPISYQWRKNGTAIGGATAGSLTISPISSGDAGSYTVVVSNACGSATSGPATLSVSAPITIDPQPASRSVCTGDSVTFTIGASGTAPISYQWQKDAVNIPGATGTSLTIDPVRASDLGSYRCIVMNVCGSVTSDAAILSITITPAITRQPADVTVCQGQSATFDVQVSGSEPISYQWQKDGGNIAGATRSSYTINPVLVAHAGRYRVIVSNPCGTVTSNEATLTVQTAPIIITPPATQSVCIGGTATFSITVSGTPPISYQWQKNSVNISGATASSYTISPVALSHAGTYRCVVTNSCGLITSPNAALIVNTGPTITVQPQSQDVQLGDSVTFSVTATGAPPLRYQWRKDGVDIPGATARTLTINPVRREDVGVYTCVVTNGCGTVTSNPANLNVAACDIFIIEQPLSATLCTGDRLTIRATANGSPAPTYQWRKNGVGIPGATASVFTIAATVVEDSGTYDLEARNICGALISDASAVIIWPRGSGDINGDGMINGMDIGGFVEVMLHNATGPADLSYCGADMNHDGVVNYADVPVFIGLLL